MSDAVKLLKGGGYLLSGTVVQALVAFAANLVLVRILLPADFGRFAVTQALAGLVLAVISLRISILVNRTPEGAMTDERYSMLMSVTVLETVFAGLVILSVAIVTNSLGPLDYTLIFSILLSNFLVFHKSMVERRQKFRRVAMMETGTQVGGHILAVGLVLMGLGPAVLYLRELFSVVALAVILKAVGEMRPLRFRFPTSGQWRQVLGEAKGIWLDSMLENCFQRLTVLAAGAIGGQSGAGMLFQAHRLAIVPHQVLQPVFTRSMGVWFCQTENRDVRVRLRRRVVHLAMPMLLMAGAADVLLADSVIPWLFGEQWRPAAQLLVWLAGVVVFLPMFELLRSYALATRRVRLLLVARVAQYAAFCLPVLPILWGDIELSRLSAALSLAFMAAFGVLALTLARHERDIKAEG